MSSEGVKSLFAGSPHNAAALSTPPHPLLFRLRAMCLSSHLRPARAPRQRTPARASAASPLAAPRGARSLLSSGRTPPHHRPPPPRPQCQVPPFPFRSARRRHLPGAAPEHLRPPRRALPPPWPRAAHLAGRAPPPARALPARSNGRRAAPQWCARRGRYREAGGAGWGGAHPA